MGDLTILPRIPDKTELLLNKDWPQEGRIGPRDRRVALMLPAHGEEESEGKDGMVFLVLKRGTR